MIEAPNADIFCNYEGCREKITHICLLSQNWSATENFRSCLPMIRDHFKNKHGIEPPLEYTSEEIQELNSKLKQ